MNSFENYIYSNVFNIFNKNRFILIPILLSSIVALFILFSPFYLMILSMIISVALLTWKQSYLMLLLPFLTVSFIPSDYIIEFRLLTPFGYLQPIIPLMSFLLFIVIVKKLFEKKRELSFSVVYLSGILFFFLYFASSSFSGLSLTGIKKIIYMMLSSLGILLFVDNYIKLEMIEKVKKIVIAVGLIVAFVGILEYITGFNPYKNYYSNFWWDKQSGHLWRIVSLVGNPLVLGAYLMLIFAVAAPMIKLNTKYSIVSIVILFVAIGLTFSRSIYVACIIITLLYLSFEHKKLQAFSIISVLFIIVIYISIIFMNMYDIGFLVKERLLFEGASYSYTHRLNSWLVTLESSNFRDIVFGVGVSNIESALAGESAMIIKTFDNSFLEILWESGIAGLVSFIVFIVSPCFMRKNAFTKDRILVMVAFIIVSFSFVTYYFQASWLTYWYIQALLLKSKTLNK